MRHAELAADLNAANSHCSVTFPVCSRLARSNAYSMGILSEQHGICHPAWPRRLRCNTLILRLIFGDKSAGIIILRGIYYSETYGISEGILWARIRSYILGTKITEISRANNFEGDQMSRNVFGWTRSVGGWCVVGVSSESDYLPKWPFGQLVRWQFDICLAWLSITWRIDYRSLLHSCNACVIACTRP